LKNKVLKLGIFSLFVSLIFGMFIFNIEKYSTKKVDDFFNYTESYSPIKIPEKIFSEENNNKIVNIVETAVQEDNLFYAFKVVDQGYDIRDGINFIFLPKQDITLFVPNIAERNQYNPPLGRSTLSIDSIASLKNSREFEWQLFIKTLDKKQYDKLIEKIRNNYNKEFDADYTSQDFSDFDKSQSYQLGIDSDMYNISTYIKTGIVFLIVILSFWAFSIKKRINILRQNGYSYISIVNTLIGKPYTFFVLISTSLLTYYIGSISKDYGVKFFVETSLFSFLCYFWLMIMVYAVNKLTRSGNEHKKITGRILNTVLPTVVKLIFLLMLVVSSIDLAMIIYKSSHLNYKKDIPKSILDDKYHVFFPVVAGKNQLDFMYDETYSQNEQDEVYQYLNEKGSLLVNIEHYNIKENEIFGRGIQINPNYLKKFTILDDRGNRILIDETDQDRVLLIPEKVKNDAGISIIKKYYYEELPPYENKSTKIIYIKDDQPVYSFVPSNPWIDDYPILDVLTTSNSTSWERNIFNGDMYPPLKVKTSDLSIKELKLLLAKNQLDDNLPSFFPYEEADITLIKRLSGSLVYLLTNSIMTTFAFSIVSLLITIYSFRYNHRKFKLLRLNGYSFFKTYDKIFLALIFEIIIGILIAMILSEISKEFVVNICLAMLLNVIIVSTTLFFVERNKSQNTKF